MGDNRFIAFKMTERKKEKKQTNSQYENNFMLDFWVLYIATHANQIDFLECI